jgi:hypothetical protein
VDWRLPHKIRTHSPFSSYRRIAGPYILWSTVAHRPVPDQTPLLNEWHNAIVKPKPVGRPLRADEAQQRQVLKLHKRGRSLRKLASRDDGSLFDLKADAVEDIASVIAANIHDGKAAALAKARCDKPVCWAKTGRNASARSSASVFEIEPSRADNHRASRRAP